jgi:23S rRNA pseudouridine1911/1915/1917 synthase
MSPPKKYLPIQVLPDQAGITLAAFARAHHSESSWSQVRRFIGSRTVRVNSELCLDPARRLKAGDVVEFLDKPDRVPAALVAELVIRHLDEHVVVVEKPAGISTVRHPAERNWRARRRELSPTLEDRLLKAIAAKKRLPPHKLPRLRKVQRLDKLTSGLLVFARSPLAERVLGQQFRLHTVDRCYQAIVPGRPRPQTIRSWLVRDRGDGRRGSCPIADRGKLAVTHLQSVEPLGEYSLVTCRLETGRTHQIRIHLADLGHPVCGDPLYRLRADGTQVADASGLSRLALHAAELGFEHPVTHERMRWSMPLTDDLRLAVERLKKKGP